MQFADTLFDDVIENDFAVMELNSASITFVILYDSVRYVHKPRKTNEIQS